MFVQVDSKSLSPATMYSVSRMGSDIAVATESGFPYPTVDVHSYSWSGSSLAYVTNAGLTPGFGTGRAGRMIYTNNYLYIPVAGAMTGGAALLYQFSYDGVNFTYVNASFFGGGGQTYGGSSAGDVTSDVTYLYCPANTYQFVFPNWVNVVRMHAINKNSMAIVGTPLNISATGFSNRVIAQGGSIFNTYAGNIRRLTFNGSVFTVAQTVANASMSVSNMVGDGTYLYIGHTDNHSILVYNNSLSLVTTYDTTFTGNQLSYAGGCVYVGSSTGTRAYTFNGATFSYVDIMSTQNISEIVV